MGKEWAMLASPAMMESLLGFYTFSTAQAIFTAKEIQLYILRLVSGELA